MAGSGANLKRGLRLIDSCNLHKSLKCNYLVPNLFPLSYSSTTSSSSLYRGRNKTSISRVTHYTHSDFFNLSKPKFYNSFVKPCVDNDPLVKAESGITKIKDNLEGFLNSDLPVHPKLIHGQLKNGLRYYILQHKKNPNRFAAHLKVDVGSVDEEDDEQGIAHMTEHVIRSDKGSELAAIGATAGACTCYYETVYHVYSQIILEHFEEDLLDEDLVGGDLVPYVLDYLNERAFKPKIRASDLEKERYVVLSEMQRHNTIDQRIDLQLDQHLFSENKLSKRRVLGLEDQIKKWNIAQIRKFHKRWYFPANATLFIVGDINDVSKTIDAIQAAFGKSKRLSKKRSSEIKNERYVTYNNWSLPRNNSTNDQKTPQIFQHELIHNFSFHIYSKIPVNNVRTYGDLRNFVMKHIYLYVLRLRIKAKYKSLNSSSTLMELVHDDFGDYGCALTNLTTTSEPKDWKTTIKVAFHEIRRLKELGINYGEFTLVRDAILKDFASEIAVVDDDSACDTMEFVMDKGALQQTIMEERDARESIAAIATTITLEETNSIGRGLLEFISDFGKPSAPVPTTIMVCAPNSHEVNGELVEFTITPSEIESTMKQGLEGLVYAEPEIEVPTKLISSSQLQELLLERQPTFIPLISSKSNVKKFHDNETNVTYRRLSNGISIMYKISKNKSGEGGIRVTIGGGRAFESSDLKGAILVGVHTLYEGCSVGHFSREQVELFCLKNKINYWFTPTDEFIYMELSFSSRDNGMQAAFQLLHILLEQSVWLEDAFARAKQLHLLEFQSCLKSLEQSTTRKLMLAMLDGDERFVDPTPISLQNLTLQTVKDAVLNQLNANNMKVNIVGDFSEENIESSIINYLGTVRSTRNFKNKLQQYDPITYRASPSNLQSQVFLKDTEERIYVCIAGLVPNNWGVNVDGKHSLESKSCIDQEEDLQNKLHDHPFFFDVTMIFLTEIINERLQQNVVGSGLAYTVELDLRLFHKLNLGWYMISIEPTADKIRKAVDVCKKILKDFGRRETSQEHLDRIRGRLLTGHEDGTKSNAYWLQWLSHLHVASALKKEISSINDIASLYKAVRIEDIKFAYDQLKISDDSIYLCTGIAGQTEITW